MKTIFKRLLVLSLAGLTFGAFAQAQQPEASNLDAALRRAATAGLSDNQLNHVLGIGYRFKLTEKEIIPWMDKLAQVRQNNLPVEPFISKMEEGLAKHIDPPTIQSVLDRQYLQFDAARQFIDQYKRDSSILIDKAAEQNFIVRIGHLFAGNVSPAELERLHESAPQAGLDSLIEAMTFKVVIRQAGVKAATTEKIISTGLLNNSFKHFPLELAKTVKTASQNKIKGEKIGCLTLSVIEGAMVLNEARRQLGLQQMAGPNSVPNGLQGRAKGDDSDRGNHRNGQDTADGDGNGGGGDNSSGNGEGNGGGGGGNSGGGSGGNGGGGHR